MLDKSYRPAEVETRISAQWDEAKIGAAHATSNKTPFSVMMPPPNVTGSLHMGHAFNMTLQDILTRYWRMRGKDALWQPGTDHAGIATQMVVERQMAAEGLDRRDMGREAFVERVWQWKAESGGTILRQLQRLGASPDWARERFTLDDGLSLAVRTEFVELYKAGLIYRDKRLVNWDPKLQTAISDLEIEQREVDGHLWHFKYPIEDEAGAFIVVATTRPETMLGDTAVAVHPEDERYTHLVGKHVILPLVGRRIPIVADAYSDPEKGSGAVKITPAHDFNDFEVGRRHDLPQVNIFDSLARLNDEVPEAYRGLDRYEAREKIVADMEAQGLLAEVETTRHSVPYGDRSGVVVEPWLTDQWYVDAATLAKPAIEAVEQGRTVFVPRNWENTYFEWMRNIQPWCISRQLWWGHRIPAWYGPDGHIFVAMTEGEAAAEAEAHYGKPTALLQDEDVLDTWFSSGLWPFSTLGWPEKTAELDRYYPTDVLVTGFDIIFFWVARMMMLGIHFMGEVPFRTVYIHALVRDEKGQKMSKSKGNIIDPLTLMDDYGTDALRFTLTAMAAQGRDIKLSEQRVAGYRNFMTKLWNAARFCEMNECWPVPGFDPASCRQTINRWIVGETVEVIEKTGAAIEEYRFNEAAQALYQFFWGEFCDWYLEFSKPLLSGSDAGAVTETRATAAWVLGQTLHALHPIAPFVTEALWESMGEGGLIAARSWPELPVSLVDMAARDEMRWVIALVGEVRAVRAEMNVPAAAKIPVVVGDATPEAAARVETHRALIETLARAESVTVASALPEGAVQIVLEGATAALPLVGVIDLGAERARLDREIAKTEDEIGRIDKKLGNQQFVSRAPAEVVEEQRERRADYVEAKTKLEAARERLATVR